MFLAKRVRRREYYLLQRTPGKVGKTFARSKFLSGCDVVMRFEEAICLSEEKLRRLEEQKAKLYMGGGEKAVQKQHAAGKQTARERLGQLFDAGSFIETGLFVQPRCTNFGMNPENFPAEGVVTGYGTVNGRLVYAAAQDFTVAGGSLGEAHAAKITTVQEAALKVGAPIIYINDSGGARIQEGVDALAG